MDKGTRILFVIFVIFLIVVGSELVIAFHFSSKKSTAITSQIPQTNRIYQNTSSQNGSSTVMGHYITSSDQSVTLFLAQLDKVYFDNTTGNINADISFNLLDGNGSSSTQTITLATTTIYQSQFTLQRRSSLSFSNNADDVRATDSLKGNAIVNSLSSFKGTKVTFFLGLSLPVSAKQPKYIHNDPYSKFMSDGFTCNNDFFNYLKLKGPKPTCHPYLFEASVYDPSQ